MTTAQILAGVVIGLGVNCLGLVVLAIIVGANRRDADHWLEEHASTIKSERDRLNEIVFRVDSVQSTADMVHGLVIKHAPALDSLERHQSDTAATIKVIESDIIDIRATVQANWDATLKRVATLTSTTNQAHGFAQGAADGFKWRIDRLDRLVEPLVARQEPSPWQGAITTAEVAGPWTLHPPARADDKPITRCPKCGCWVMIASPKLYACVHQECGAVWSRLLPGQLLDKAPSHISNTFTINFSDADPFRMAR